MGSVDIKNNNKPSFISTIGGYIFLLAGLSFILVGAMMILHYVGPVLFPYRGLNISLYRHGN